MQDYEELEYVPPTDLTPEEISDYCQFLGLNPKEDPDLLWIAEEGLRAPLPKEWIYFQHKTENKSFFYNQKTGVSTEEHPADEYYLKLFKEEKAKKKGNLGQVKSKKQQKSMIVETPKLGTAKIQPSPVNQSYSNAKNIPKNEYSYEESYEYVDDNTENTEKSKKDYELKIENLEKQHKKEIDDIKAKYENEKKQQQALLDQERKKNENLQNQLKQNDELREFDADHDNKLRELRNKYDIEISNKKKEYQNELNSYNQKIIENTKKCQEEISKTKKECDRKIAQIISEYEAEKTQQLSKHKKEMQQLQADNKKEIDEFTEQHKKTIENLRKIHEDKLRKIKAKAANHLETVSAQYSSPARSESTTPGSPSKKRDYQKELSKQDEQQQKRIADLRSQFEESFTKQQRENNAKIEALKQECEDEVRRYKKQLESDKKRILASAKKEARERALSNSLASCSIDTTRIASIKPRPKFLRSILQISKPFSAHLADDEYYGDLEMSKNVVVVDIEGDDGDSLTEVPPFNDGKYPIRGKILSDSSLSSDDSDLFAQTDTKTAKIQNAAAKANAQFGASADKAANGISSSFKELENKSGNLRSYCAEQNRDLTKMALEFQQRTIEISKMFHNTLMELESAHRSAINVVGSAREIIPNPPHICYTPPPPRRQKRVVYEPEDTSDDRDTTTLRFVRKYEREQQEAKNSNKRLKRRYAEARLDIDSSSF